MKSILMKTMIGMVACASLVFTTSCDDDDDAPSTNSNPITINAIYLEDAESDIPSRKLEDPYNFVRLGQTIRIEGSGLSGINRIYINGYSCYFNNAIMTDNNVWLTVSGDVPIVDAEPDVRNTIVLSKASGVTATYNITVRAAAPTIEGFSQSLPQPGEEVTVYGTGLLEVTAVQLPSGNTVTEGIVCDEDGEWFTFPMPAGETKGGSIFITCANGGAYSPACFNYSAGMIINFDGVGVQGAWGWSETGSMIDPADDRDGQIVDPLNSGRGYVQCMTPDRLMPMPMQARLAEIWTAGGEKGAWSDPTEDWTRLIDGDLITEATSLNDLAIQFDMYIDGQMTTGYFTLMLQNNFSSVANRPYSALFTPVLDNGGEPVETEGWETVNLPLTEFLNFTADDGEFTFADVLAMRKEASYANFGLLLHNADLTIDEVVHEATAQIENVKIYVDNFRLVNMSTPTFNEFGDEEQDDDTANDEAAAE